MGNNWISPTTFHERVIIKRVIGSNGRGKKHSNRKKNYEGETNFYE